MQSFCDIFFVKTCTPWYHVAWTTHPSFLSDFICSKRWPKHMVHVGPFLEFHSVLDPEIFKHGTDDICSKTKLWPWCFVRLSLSKSAHLRVMLVSSKSLTPSSNKITRYPSCSTYVGIAERHIHFNKCFLYLCFSEHVCSKHRKSLLIALRRPFPAGLRACIQKADCICTKFQSRYRRQMFLLWLLLSHVFHPCVSGYLYSNILRDSWWRSWGFFLKFYLALGWDRSNVRPAKSFQQYHKK